MQFIEKTKINNLLLAILIISSTQHWILFSISGFVNIMLFDFLLIFYSFLLFPLIMFKHFDRWLMVFIFLILFQFIHNILMSNDFVFTTKEFIQSFELVLFYLVLKVFFDRDENVNKIIEYTFYGLCLLTIMALLKYYIPWLPAAIDIEEIREPSKNFQSYLKPSAVINMLIPIIIFSFYFLQKNLSLTKKILTMLILILSGYLAFVSGSRAFLLMILIVFFDFFITKKKIILLPIILIFIFCLGMFYKSDILKIYDEKYYDKVNATYQYITNDEPFYWLGHKQLMIIELPSNRERLHYFKLSYQNLKNNIFFGMGSKQLQKTTNIHGNIFIYFNAFGIFYLIIFSYLVFSLYYDSKTALSNRKAFLAISAHYYIIYAIVAVLFISAGNFPLLPLVIAAALINLKNEEIRP